MSDLSKPKLFQRIADMSDRTVWVIRTLNALMIAGIVGVVGIFFYALLFNEPFDDMNFDRAMWIEHHQDDSRDNPRGLMVDSLIDDHLEIGMSKADVIDLLGPPDFGEQDDVLLYHIGWWSGFRMDADSLTLRFSNDDKLIKFYWQQH